MIEIMNLKDDKPVKIYDVRVDRKSHYGNLHYMSDESQRDTVCDAYKAWFDDYIALGGTKFNRLVKLYKKYGRLRLFCHCAPKRCHAEIIGNYILKEALKG